jgi:hypothetical protein
VFDSDLFDDVFGGLVAVNSEGHVISNQGTTGFVLTDSAVARFTDGREPVQAAGARSSQACLQTPDAPTLIILLMRCVVEALASSMMTEAA